MATIGTFKKTANNEFVGEIVTLSVQAKGVRIVPETSRANDNAPSHRVSSRSFAPARRPPAILKRAASACSPAFWAHWRRRSGIFG